GGRASWQVEGVGPGHGPQPGRARPGVALEGGAVDPHEPERRAVAERPLEIVERAPVRVPAHVDAVVEAAADPLQGPANVGDAALVVVGGDAVLGDEQRYAAGDLPRPTEGRLQHLGPELVAHLGHLHPWLRAEGAGGA